MLAFYKKGKYYFDFHEEKKISAIFYTNFPDFPRSEWQLVADWQLENNYITTVDPNPLHRIYFWFLYVDGSYRGSIVPRLVHLNGTFNFRDLGGYVTEDYHVTKYGALYRGDALCTPTEDDLVFLQNSHIDTVIDLRSPREIAKKPDVLPPHTNYYEIDPQADIAKNAGSIIQTSKDDRRKIEDLEKMYREEKHNNLLKNNSLMAEQMKKMVTNHASIAAYKEFFKILLNNGENPVFFHCQGGKDRTGWASILILSALGVPKKAIFEDYMLTGVYGKNRNVKRMEEYRQFTDNKEILQFLYSHMETRADFFDAAWNEATNIAGSMENYLSEFLLVKKNEIEILKKFYLV